MLYRRSFEMSIVREDFVRLLPSAVGPFHLDGQVARFSDGARAWIIILVPLEDRRLGRMALPRHRVEVTLEGYSEREAEAFIERFQRGFLRAGG
jgi:hypothetical protein